MLLNGWKEIAAYLKCGVRTAQRWASAGMPVSRVGKSIRGPVMAFSEKLDSWVQRNGSPALLHPQHAKIITTIRKTMGQTADLMERTRRQQREFVRVEIATGKHIAKLARLSSQSEETRRRTVAARRAYDEANGALSRLQFLTKQEGKQFRAELRELKHTLQDLGEKF